MTEPSRQLLAALCGDLRLLWRQAGGPSLRALAHEVALSKSQLGAILAGEVKRPPDWQVVQGLVAAMERFAVANGRLDQVSLRTGVEEYWRPRYNILEHAFDQAPPTAASPEPAVATQSAPALLPWAVAGFVGRERELDRLDQLLAGDDRRTRIAVVSGTPGIGKTTLAVHWAHRVARHFPDGLLYLNLRGFDPSGSTMDTGEAVRVFLDALGVPGPRIPASLVAQTSLYRSVLAGRRVLLVLDNAREANQVRDLLPGSLDCVVIVTSRNALLPLIATEGATPVALGFLTPDEARELLVRRLGEDRVAGDEDAVREIADRCAHLPLAMAVAAARAATRRIYPLADLAADLLDGSMDSLTTDDPATDVRAVFSWSYQALSDDAARLFRLLGLHPGPDISRTAAASLAGRAAGEVRRQLDDLADAHLVMEQVPGRYALHDLMRAYAAELSHQHDDPEDRAAAGDRMRDHYLHSAAAAVATLGAQRWQIELEPPLPGVRPDAPADQDAGMYWFTAELRVLLAAARSSFAGESRAHTWKLATVAQPYLDRQGQWADLIVMNELAAAEATRLDDRQALAYAQLGLGLGHYRIGQTELAQSLYHSAADRFLETGDKVNAARALINGALAEPPGQESRALPHALRGYELYREAGHVGQASALNAICWFYTELGEYEPAIDHGRRSLALHQENGDGLGEAAAWDSLGYAHHRQGHYDEAIDCYRQALDKQRRFGSRYHNAEVLRHLGDSYQASGDQDAAHRCWQEALDILEALDHPDAEAVRDRIRESSGS